MYDEYPGDPFYSGGYNTLRLGSRDGGTLDAIQVECNRNIRFDEEARLGFAEDIAEILLNYLKEHYFANLEDFYDTSMGRDNLLRDSGIEFFPNPVKDILHVKAESEAEIEIFNLQGQEIYSGQISGEKDLSLSGLKKGMYILVLKKDGIVLVKNKLIKDWSY